jgi:hypothetical protein
VAPMPYTALQQMMDPMGVPGLRYYLKAPFLRELDDAAIDSVLRAHRTLTSPMSELASESSTQRLREAPPERQRGRALSAIGLGYLRGAISDVPSDHTAFAHRHAAWMCDIIAAWPSSADDARHVEWARSVWSALDRVSTGSYVNHLADDEIDSQRGYTDAQSGRLAALKARWDPDNVLRLNANVSPAAAA